LCYEATRGWTPGKVDRLVNAACPPGTTRTEVKAWLDSEPFIATFPSLLKPESRWRGVKRGKYNYKEHLTQEIGGKLIWRIEQEIPDPNVDIFFAGRMTLILTFDGERLVKHEVKVWILSL
jgi:hypothetical protein